MPITGRHASSTALALLIVGASIAGCGNDGADAGRFCGEIDANQAALFAPQLTSATEIAPLLDLYRKVGELAPLAVEDDWNQLIVNYETASTVVPGDPASEQAAAAEAYQTEKSAVAVKQWLIDNCAVDIGPVATIVAHDG